VCPIAEWDTQALNVRKPMCKPDWVGVELLPMLAPETLISLLEYAVLLSVKHCQVFFRWKQGQYFVARNINAIGIYDKVPKKKIFLMHKL